MPLHNLFTSFKSYFDSFYHYNIKMSTQISKNDNFTHTNSNTPQNADNFLSKEEPKLSLSNGGSECEKPEEAKEQHNNEGQPHLNIDQEKILARRNNLFGNKLSENKVSIFNSHKSVNLFSLNNSTNFTNIFANAAKKDPIVQPDEEEEPSEGSQGPEPSVQEEPPKGQMKYDYGPGMQSLGEFKLKLFRAGSNTAKESVEVSLQKPKETQESINVLYMIVRNPATKLSLYKGMLLSGVKPETFMNRPQNLKFYLMHMEVKGEKTVHERELVKMQFTEQSEAERFANILQQFFRVESKDIK